MTEQQHDGNGHPKSQFSFNFTTRQVLSEHVAYILSFYTYSMSRHCLHFTDKYTEAQR